MCHHAQFMPCWGWNPGLSAFKSDSKRKFPSPRYATESSFSGVLGRFPSFPNNRSVCASCPQHSWSMAAGVPHCTQVCWSDVRPRVGVQGPPFVSWALVCSGSAGCEVVRVGETVGHIGLLSSSHPGWSPLEDEEQCSSALRW